MRGSSSELLLDPQQQLRKRKLLELAQNKNKKKVKRTCKQKIWFYTTSFFAMTAVSTGSSLLFLVPLYVDPAISTLTSDFNPNPVTCVTILNRTETGIFNCTWSSCREGCTSDMYKCFQIFVKYVDYNVTFSEEPLYVDNAILLVNIKGCGYPPEVQCANFASSYGMQDKSYPCYYSRKNTTIVMDKYDEEEQMYIIIHYFIIPFIICVVCSIVLCVMHCECQCNDNIATSLPPSKQRPDDEQRHHVERHPIERTERHHPAPHIEKLITPMREPQIIELREREGASKRKVE
ncbi:hypothetical protein M8J76_006435 [Diaphorina citri]|nr:hypothetical protein M8J76_006435 [Diaphorina citri]KAI5732176.1 hypothetical protein M8J77_022718 [Diaphorina citri]